MIDHCAIYFYQSEALILSLSKTFQQLFCYNPILINGVFY